MKTTGTSSINIEMQPGKPYLKPRIERVGLIPEETVLGFCKGATTTTNHSSQANCGWGPQLAPCDFEGS